MKSILKSLFLISLAILPSHVSAKSGDYRNPTGDRFPIMAWSTFYEPDMITPEGFKWFSQAGFNISEGYVDSFESVEKQIEYGARYGVMTMVGCPQTTTVTTIPRYAGQLKNNPNIAGYFVIDEPMPENFSKWTPVWKELVKTDPNHYPYINLFPLYYEKLNDSIKYTLYLEQFIEDFDPPYLSYDNYPVMETNGKITVREEFYPNLEIVSSVSKKHNIPFWAFCLSASFWRYPTPTEAFLTFEAFSALAYGAQGLSYYTYRQRDYPTLPFHAAPIDTLGKRTKVWYTVRNVNRQIQALRDVFLGCKVVQAAHTGKWVWTGCTRLTTLPAPFADFKSGDQGVLLSHITNRGKDYAVIVNHSVTEAQKLSFDFLQPVRRVMPDGSQRNFRARQFNLPPGSYLILTWN